MYQSVTILVEVTLRYTLVYIYLRYTLVYIHTPAWIYSVDYYFPIILVNLSKTDILMYLVT